MLALIAVPLLAVAVCLCAALVSEAAVFGLFVLGVQLALGALLIYVGHALLRIAWHDYPTATVGAGAVLALSALFARLRRVGSPPERDDDDGDGGGGGGGPRKPPAPPEPPAPSGQDPDWTEFDELRRGWERVPEPVG